MGPKLMEMFRKLCGSHHIVSLQEVHGNEFDLHYLDTIAPTHLRHHSSIAGRSAGGITISVDKLFLEKFSFYEFVEVEPGRVLRFQANGRGGNIQVIALHLDPALRIPALRELLRAIKSSIALDPKNLTFVMGDTSARPGDEP